MATRGSAALTAFVFPQLYPSGTGNFRANGIPDVSISGYANFKGPSFALHSPSTDIQIVGQHFVDSKART